MIAKHFNTVTKVTLVFSPSEIKQSALISIVRYLVWLSYAQTRSRSPIVMTVGITQGLPLQEPN